MRKIVSLLPVLLLLCTLAFGQSRTVSGVVRDEKGDPIPFATIQETGTKFATQADANGNFVIKLNPGARLTISSTGHRSQTVDVTGNTVSVVMPTVTNQLSEVVVTTALGIKRQAKELGYSTQTINSQELNQAHVTNAATGLIGKVSGLQIITQDNGVNPNVKIQMRGVRSILGNNQALVVVDGSIVPTSFLSTINPNDIESVNVLKGPAASALYGSDASNGVFVVTTKRGTRGGKPIIRVGSNVQFQSVSFMPKLQNQFGAYGGEGNYIDPVTGKTTYVPFENQSFGPRFDGKMVPLGMPIRLFRANGTPYDTTKMIPYSAVDKLKFWDIGLQTQNDVSVSMGDENSTTFIALQHVNNAGVVPMDKFERTTARVNGSRNFNRFRIDYSADYTQQYSNTVGSTFFQDRPLYFAVINTPQEVPLRDLRNINTDPFAGINGYFNAYYPNPWWQIYNSRVTSRREDLLGNINFSYKFTSWLSANYRIGYASTEFLAKNTKAGVQFSDYEITDPFGISNIASTVKSQQPSEADGNTFFSKITGDLLVTAAKEFGNFSTKLIVGHSVQQDYRRDMNLASSAIAINDFYNIGATSVTPTYGEATYSRNIQGAFADLTLGYNSYIYAHGSFRSNTYSTLSPQNRNFNFGSGDISFVFTDAFRNIFANSAINYGKLRVSYATVGQVSLDNLNPYGTYLTSNTFSTGPGFPFNAPGFTISNNNNNQNIKPEITTEKEIGLELGFLKNRLLFTANVFQQNTTNETLPSQTSWATGFSSTLINSGEVQNKGLELELKGTPIANANGLRWDVGINFTYIQNKVISLPGGSDVYLGGNSYAIVGKPIQAIKVTDWNRDSATGKVIVNVNGDPSRNSNLIYVGSAFQPYQIGVNTSLSFKGITLQITADYRSGGVIFNQIGQDLDFSGISAHSAYGNRERFVFPNSVYQDNNGKYVTNTNRTISNVYNFWSGNISAVGTPYITSAAYWKLREVNLTYELPRKWINGMRIVKGINVGVFGRNLITWLPKENIWTDPEFNASAAFNDAGTTTNTQTPPTRFYGFNLSVTF